MKVINILIFVVSIFFLNSCSNSSNTVKEEIINQSDIVKKSIDVGGMTCVGCEVTLEKSIFNISGVVSVIASHSESKARIEFDSTKTDLETIKKVVKESGYNLLAE